LDPRLISFVRLFDSSIVGNIFTDGHDSINRKGHIPDLILVCEASILVHQALCLLMEEPLRIRIPPVTELAIGIEVTSLVVITVSDLMSDDPPNRSIIHEGWAILIEKVSLQDPCRELNRVGNRLIESIHHGWLPKWNPVVFKDGLVQLFHSKICRPFSEV